MIIFPNWQVVSQTGSQKQEWNQHPEKQREAERWRERQHHSSAAAPFWLIHVLAIGNTISMRYNHGIHPRPGEMSILR